MIRSLIYSFLCLFSSLSYGSTNDPTLLDSIETAFSIKNNRENRQLEKLNVTLVDPQQAPLQIREMVMLGYNIMLHTAQFAPEYSKDQLSCTHCHFSGGDSTGGRKGGISLVGAAGQYPRYDSRTGGIQDFASRINSCFERSMNGKPLPLDSKQMLALQTYLHWISLGTPIYKPIPWLGLPKLKSQHLPDPIKGAEIYSTSCALCHKQDGSGDIEHQIPPVWGDRSFNDGAGMNQQEILASFIYYNMPYNNPSLSEEEAIDVAAFMVAQPRAHFKDSTR